MRMRLRLRLRLLGRTSDISVAARSRALNRGWGIVDSKTFSQKYNSQKMCKRAHFSASDEQEVRKRESLGLGLGE